MSARSTSSFGPERPAAPEMTPEQAAEAAASLYGVSGEIRELPSYIDRNFLIAPAEGPRWVFKIANASESYEVLDLQNAAMVRLCECLPGVSPELRPSVHGRAIELHEWAAGRGFVRMVSYVEGDLLAQSKAVGATTWRSLGALLGHVDSALAELEHAAMHRSLRWDLARADWTLGYGQALATPALRILVQRAQLAFLATVQRTGSNLPRGLIFNDANDHNLVTRENGGQAEVVGLFDFGDVVHTARIFELAIAGAYAALGSATPLEVLSPLVAAYHAILPLEPQELEAFFPALCMRLAVSLHVSAIDRALDPDNEYIAVSESPAADLLDRLMALDPVEVRLQLSQACGLAVEPAASRGQAALQSMRRRYLGPSLSLSYARPLTIVKGRAQYLFDDHERAYLDCVNNVCHVGHCHPTVVEAAQRQIAQLNTNTRYLHDNIVSYAERLSALFPDPLSVCFFVNSGSEANELALRMARQFTGRQSILCIGGGYHGNTSTMIDVSPYKHDGPGGAGAPEWVYSVPCPDTYRGPYGSGADAGQEYAAHVERAMARAESDGRPIAAWIGEPLIGCGGQIVPPEGYFAAGYEHVRAAGGLCIADEVQVGFGRVGTHLWAFEQHGVVPDIVTMGKPMGNGHPMAGVITTPEIAAAFDNGMEFFSTFGGNPVSCAIGMAVLDTIEADGLQANALRVGEHLLNGFRELQERYETIGEVRGRGLYLGVELVRSRTNKEPDAELLARLIERCRERGVLLSSDGPDHNVLKIKPPLPFSIADAELLLSVFETAMEQEGIGATAAG